MGISLGGKALLKNYWRCASTTAHAICLAAPLSSRNDCLRYVLHQWQGAHPPIVIVIISIILLFSMFSISLASYWFLSMCKIRSNMSLIGFGRLRLGKKWNWAAHGSRCFTKVQRTGRGRRWIIARNTEGTPTSTQHCCCPWCEMNRCRIMLETRQLAHSNTICANCPSMGSNEAAPSATASASSALSAVWCHSCVGRDQDVTPGPMAVICCFAMVSNYKCYWLY
jgi:hypothetical protein